MEKKKTAKRLLEAKSVHAHIVLVRSPLTPRATFPHNPFVRPHSCVIKPSEMAPNSAKVIQHLVETYLDPTCFRVVQGAVPETTALLKLRWDHIIYTGNGAVAKIVMNAAAKHLIPVTLELGGKSPVIIDETAKLSLAVRRLAFGKWLNVGQTCVSPDYVLVHRSRKDEFLRELSKVVRKMYGSDPRKSRDYGRIIHPRHAERIESLLKGTKGEVIRPPDDDAGSVDAVEKYVPPTIVVDPPASDRLLRDEIFGPVLPVCTFDTIDEAVSRIAEICDHPLALYIFSESEANVDRILDTTASGGVGVNCVMEQLHDQLPFGGVGESGMGRYGGKWGFEEFSHFRAVCVKDTRFTGAGVLLPPYGPKVYDLGIRFLVTGFFTDVQRRVLKALAATSGVAVAAFLLRRGMSRL